MRLVTGQAGLPVEWDLTVPVADKDEGGDRFAGPMILSVPGSDGSRGAPIFVCYRK